jgi:hypothetical protein
MRILGLEIRRASPRCLKNLDLFWKCPRCGKFIRLRRLDDGSSLLSVLFNVDKLNRIELECNCGQMLTICSQVEADASRGPVDWKIAIARALEGQEGYREGD